MKSRLFILFAVAILVITLCFVVAFCGSFGDSKNTSTQAPDHDHVYELTVLVPPSCGVRGNQAYVCAICGKQQNRTDIAAWEHNYNTVSSWSDCTSPGEKVDTCENCGDRKVEILEALGHDWKSLTYHDLKSNELTITPFCARCYSAPMQEHRYKLIDIEKLAVTSSDLYGELDYKYATDKGYSYVLKAPYYRIYCEGNYVLIVRNTKSFDAYSPHATPNISPLNFYKSQGCTVVYEANITSDGRLPNK